MKIVKQRLRPILKGTRGGIHYKEVMQYAMHAKFKLHESVFTKKTISSKTQLSKSLKKLENIFVLSSA